MKPEAAVYMKWRDAPYSESRRSHRDHARRAGSGAVGLKCRRWFVQSDLLW